jgi:CHAT domain-containing protein/tetratricopeptide (TPR) repeat protein
MKSAGLNAFASASVERTYSLQSEAAPTKAKVRMAAAVILELIALTLTSIAVWPAAAQSREELLQEASGLNTQGDALYQQRRYADAEPLYKRALAIREKALGPENPSVALSLANLALVYENEGRYADAEPLFKQALAIEEKALGPEHPDVATSLNNLANVYYYEGRYTDAEPLDKRALAIREKVLGPENPSVARSLNNLAELYRAEGHYADAEPLQKRALAIREKVLGPENPSVALSLDNLAKVYQDEGRYADAELLQKRALAIEEKALGPEHPDVARSLNNLAAVYYYEGRYADAEPLLKQALAIREKALGPEHPDVARSLNNLSELYRAEGHYADAEPLLKRALAIWETTIGPEHLEVATGLGDLAMVYRAEGRYADAEPLLKRALAIWETTLGPEHPEVAAGLGDLAAVYESEGRYADAEPLFNRALAIYEKALRPEHPSVAAGLNNLAYLYRLEGHYADAVPLFKRALVINEKALGPEHPHVANILNELADTYNAEGKVPPAREAYERARKITLDVERSNQALDEKTLASLVHSGTQYLPNYASLLAKLVREPKLDSTLPSPDAEGLAFVVAEQARGTMAQAALAKAAVRAAAGDPATADLARHLQDLINQRADSAKLLDAEYAKLEQNADRLGNLQKQSQSLNAQLVAASVQLYKVCPRCGELTAPDPITAADTQKLLRPGEALVSYLTLDDRVLAWAVRSDAPISYLDTPLKRADLEAMVARVRASLSPGRPYDVADAFAIEKLLLKPFSKDLAGIKHLIIVPDDPLLPVPFAALVVNDQGAAYAALDDAYRKGIAPSPTELRDNYPRIPWLARSDFTTSELPSATSLRALRGLPDAGALPAAQREPFIGVGDPALGGTGGERGGSMLAARGASLIDDIRKLPRLPGTRDELMADAKALGADPSSALFMGERATKPEVMELNHERLARARVIAFATHALIGGELTGLKEPALVLTPPRQPTENDDGLLALDDVMELKLKQTEWVVLSACNTAAPGGSGEGFSGLVRAFFYAGTPTLLVSQWSVDDAATDQLMTAVFTAYGHGAGVSRAAALHDAMLKLMEMPRTDAAPAYFAHPFAWAPFIVVGEGGAPRPTK